MQLSPSQVVLLSASIFVGIVGSSLIVKYLTNEKFRQDFTSSERSKFFQSIAPQLRQQEQDVAEYAENYQPEYSNEDGNG